MTFLIIFVLALIVLFGWSAMTTCSLDAFRPSTTVPSQLTGPTAHADLVKSLLTLPGVRLLERTDDDVLISVMPVPTSMERGLGFFAIARHTSDGVVVLGRSRLPLPSPWIDSAVRQLERDARMRSVYGL